MQKKKIDTRDLINKVEKAIRNKMASEPVVQLGAFREVKKKLDPNVVLVIEDDETMRAGLKRILESEGHVVRLAADGSELASVLGDTPPDLIILDIGLPWLNGFEVAELFKDHKDLRNIPILFVSGNTNEADIQRAFDVGASDYIKKPFDIEKLKKSVATLLKINEE